MYGGFPYISAFKVAVTFTGAKVGQFYVVTRNQHVLGLDITVEDAFMVGVLDGFEQLVHVQLDFLLGQWVSLVF